MRKNKNFKKLMIFAISALMVFSAMAIVANAAYIQIGTGTSTEPYIPVYTYYDYGWSEELFLQTEIGSAIEIIGVQYYVNSYSGTFPHTINDCRLYIAHSTQTTLTTTKPDSSAMTLVYSGGFTIYQIGWNTITFNVNSFNYNNVDNLLLYWENWDGDYDYPYPYFRYTYTYPYRAVYDYQDGSMPDTGSTTSYLANIRLNYRCDHDVAIMDIVSPDDAEGYGSVPVQVEVTNIGLNTETFPVNVKIRDLTAPKTTLFSEDFTGISYGYLPTGWTEDPYASGSYHWGVYPYGPYAGGTSPELRFYYYPYETNVFRCYTPAINTMGYTELELEFKMYLNQNYQPYTLSVETSTDAINWNTAWSINPSADIPATTEQILLDAGDGIGSSTLYISFTVDGYSYNAYYWYIDDVLLQTPSPVIYDQTVTMTSLGVGSTSLADLPDWVIGTPGLYEVTAEAQLGTDCDYSNNIMTKITQVGLVDAELLSIDYPKALMGPAPFHPVATVNNSGDLDFDIATVGQLPVHATVLDPSGGTGVCFTEDFEGSTSFYEYEGDVNVLFNPDEAVYKYGDFVGAPGYIEWPENKPGFGAPGDWMILNPDNNGVIWHPTTYRSSSPDQSMYCGDENTKMYLPNSYDVMISPKVHVGSTGGSFGFSIFNDVEGGSTDYVYFGTSKDMISWHWWWFGGSWWANWQTYSGIPIYSTDVDGNGDCYMGFAFFSNSMYEYEGVYIDDLQVQGSPYLYDETVLVDLPAGEDLQIEFPLFNAVPGYDNYVLEVCCEHPEDNIPANDCDSQAFNNNAPVYNLDTGLGYLTIQEGVNDAQEDQTVVAQDGTFYENVVLNRSIILTGSSIQSTLDKTTCTYEHDHGTFLVGTVDIVPVPEEAGGPCFCDYEICLIDTFGDGWNGGMIDVIVDGVIVYDDLTLVSGAGPECHTFTVEDGSTIEIIWTAGSWASENVWELYDSEGNLVVSWQPYYDGAYWSGTATCPCGGGACTCDYQIDLYDTYGDGWDVYYYGGPNTLDVIVDGVIVLDDITCYGYGPNTFTFTVEDGSSIVLDYETGAGYYPSENYFDLWDSEGNLVLNDYFPYNSGDWSGTATCPPCASFSDPEPGMAVLQKFDITPGVTLTDEEAAVYINRSNVLVQMNTIHNVEGTVNGNISGIEIDGDNSTEPLTNVIIENNTIYTVLNYGGRSSFSRDTVFFDNFDSYPNDYTFDATVNCGYWDQINYGSACGSTYHYIMVEDYKRHSEPYSAEFYYNCPNDDWLISPPIDLTTYSNAELEFWYMWDDSWDVEFEVYVRELGQPWVFQKYYWLPGTSPETWYPDTIDISAFDGKIIEIAWDYLSNDEWALYIDDVLVTAEPGGGPGPGGGECAAIGVFEHGFLEQTTVIDNRLEQVHATGRSYGVDYAPENVAPTTFQPATDWIQYCDDYTENGLGLTAGGTVTEAIQLTDTELASYRGMDICELVVSIGCDAYGADAGIPYDVWIETSQPADPTTATVYGSGTSDSSIWNTIDIDDYTIPDTGDVWLGILMTHPSGVYPMGFDTTHTTPTRGGYLWYVGGSWTDLGSVGYPGVWGIKVGVCAGGGGGGGPVDITVNCNYFNSIGDGSVFGWIENGTVVPPYPGVMVNIEEPEIPGPGNASSVTLKCNYFDTDCIDPLFAVENKDMNNTLDATLNFWGAVDGPDSDPLLGDVQDPITGFIANGRGCSIVNNGQVMFDPWLGVHALISSPVGDTIFAETGEKIPFDATGSYAFCFPTCEECCQPVEQDIQVLWDFDDGLYSSNMVAHHIFDQAGVYNVRLQVDAVGFPYWNNFMYDFDYITVIVSTAGSPLDANADGGNLGGYETTIDSPVTLYGTASGGKAPYFYSWDFGDGTSTQTGSQTGYIVTHKYREPGTYTVTLTVTDMNSNRVTDTSTVTVYDIDELVIGISGQSNIAQGDSITFTSTVSGGRAPYAYSWDFGDGVISKQAKPTHIYENSGIYTVSLTVTDNSGTQKTKTKTVTVSAADTEEVEIKDVKGGLGVRATISTQSETSWSIQITGKVFLGGSSSGTVEQGITQVRLPFTIAIGKVDIRIAAGTTVKQYSAVMFGPLVFNVHEK